MTRVSYGPRMAPTATTPNAWALHSVTQPDNVVELRPSGPLDSSTARFLAARLDALVHSGHDQIVLDLRYVDRLDAVGMAPVRRTAALLDATGGQLTIRERSGEVAEPIVDAA